MNQLPVFSMIAAIEHSRGISQDGRLPWHLPTDVAAFCRITTGPGNQQNAVIMGRLTWESLPATFRPLPGRRNIVLTTQPALVSAAQAESSWESALVAASRANKIFVVGGARVYEEGLRDSRCRELILTRVDASLACDRFFPAFEHLFRRAEVLQRGNDQGTAFSIERWQRYTAQESLAKQPGSRPRAYPTFSHPPMLTLSLPQPGPYIFIEPEIGLEMVLFIDSQNIGPAVGGTRTQSYATLSDMLAEAKPLATAMTLKSALAGLPCSGAKLIVNQPPAHYRAQVFARIGQLLADFGGAFITGADSGTTSDDMESMAHHAPSLVHRPNAILAQAAGRGLLACIQAAAEVKGKAVKELHVAVQGAGFIGSAVAHALKAAGCQVTLADLDASRAHAVAASVGANTATVDEILALDVDIVCPCAGRHVIDHRSIDKLQAWAVVGAANNIVATREDHRRLADREILHVPDVIASAGPVTAALAGPLLGASNPWVYVDRLGRVAAEVLRGAAMRGTTPINVAEEIARENITRARNQSSP